MPLSLGPAASRYRAAGPCRAGVGTPVAESADAREAPSRRKAGAYSPSPAHVQSRARPGSAPASARSGRLAADDLEVLGQKPVSSSRARPKQRLSPSVSVPKGPKPAPPARSTPSFPARPASSLPAGQKQSGNGSAGLPSPASAPLNAVNASSGRSRGETVGDQGYQRPYDLHGLIQLLAQGDLGEAEFLQRLRGAEGGLPSSRLDSLVHETGLGLSAAGNPSFGGFLPAVCEGLSQDYLLAERGGFGRAYAADGWTEQESETAKMLAEAADSKNIGAALVMAAALSEPPPAVAVVADAKQIGAALAMAAGLSEPPASEAAQMVAVAADAKQTGAALAMAAELSEPLVSETTQMVAVAADAKQIGAALAMAAGLCEPPASETTQMMAVAADAKQIGAALAMAAGLSEPPVSETTQMVAVAADAKQIGAALAMAAGLSEPPASETAQMVAVAADAKQIGAALAMAAGLSEPPDELMEELKGESKLQEFTLTAPKALANQLCPDSAPAAKAVAAALRHVHSAPAGPPLGSEAWAVLRRIFRRLEQDLMDGQEGVPKSRLVEEIISDGQVLQEGWLKRPVDKADPFKEDAPPPASFAQALLYLNEQLLPLVTWERFRWLVVESSRFQQPLVTESQDFGGVMDFPIHSAGPEAESPGGFATGGSFSSTASPGCQDGPPVDAVGPFPFDPDAEPERAIQCMEDELHVDGRLLCRIFERFTYCRRSSSAARGEPAHCKRVMRDEFVRSVQACPGLHSALATTPLLPAGAVAVKVPMIWGDVLLGLTQHEYGSLAWSDVLAVVRQIRDLSLGLGAPASRGEDIRDPDRLRPALDVGKARARLDKIRACADRIAGPSLPQLSAHASEQPRRAQLFDARPDLVPRFGSPDEAFAVCPPLPSLPPPSPRPPVPSPFVVPVLGAGAADEAPVRRWVREADDCSSPVAAVADAFARSVGGMGSAKDRNILLMYSEFSGAARPRHPLLDYNSDEDQPGRSVMPLQQAAVQAAAPCMGTGHLQSLPPESGGKRFAALRLQVASGETSAGGVPSVRHRLSQDQLEAEVAKILGLTVGSVRLKS
ncbi:unnamed protein product [Polarella glacialis]|uniref:Uncharacterized protein n=1 Tax=Polarella glacialis TaxID=89957 RepID=A0A813J612_POLGL|nr:unnamed protein product [Polarella glacialis]